ncbi:MAG: hypothetical protein DRN61_06555 [Thaumarchaeota archaeon]|mgnify:CR=1 FL=1|nr:MAG: hypothetical protein DRN61_06555 [Nitrososphaerota archaeon]
MKPEEVIPGLRALIVKDLVERHGFSRKKVAEILGVTSPAVTLYLQGKRAGDMAKLLRRRGALKLVREFTDHVVERGGKISMPALYDLAFSVITLIEHKVTMDREEGLIDLRRNEAQRLLQLLRERFEIEQKSAEKFMRIASRLRNQALRMLIRMIARDCIKHADIMMLLMSIVESGGEMKIDLPDIELLDKLLSEEKSFHIYGLNEIRKMLPHKLLAILVDCIADDEKKHERILKNLVNYARVSEEKGRAS